MPCPAARRAGTRGARRGLHVPVEANSVFLQLSEPALEFLRARGWRFYTFIGTAGRVSMCSWDTKRRGYWS